MKYLRAVIGLAILLALLWVFYDYSLNRRIPLLGFEGRPLEQGARAVPTWQVILSATAMVLGILFGSVYERLRNKGDDVRFTGELSASLRSAHFFKAMLAAPILFAGVYVASRSQPDLVVALLFAFQNGFFCDAILRDAKGGKG